jgi:type I restriction enzyme S subunit
VSFSDWREVRIGEVISFNPSESLKKGEIAKKIAMEQLEPFTRKIANYELSKFTGGSKFRNGDTLFARITPCLENGKTAYVNILDDNEVAFGSTEFIVMRKKEKITDDMFVYYLAISPDFRNKAIQSMTGTSGRQRVQQDVLQSHKIMLPPLHEQKAIAATLSALDDMIELNNQINKTLEEMAQAIFKSWFVDFEPFRDGEFEESEIGPIPKGWKVGMLGDFVEIVDNRGKTPPLSDVKTEYPIIDVRALSGESRVIDYSNCTKYVEKEIYDSWFRSGHPKHLDILISTVGSIAEMKMFYGNKGCIAQNVVAFRSNGISPCYLYQYLQYSKGDLLSYNIGSVQPSIKVTHVIKYKIIVPDEKTMSSFDMLMESISDQIHRNANESQILIAIRDTLLPKLISGEIRVPVEEVV